MAASVKAGFLYGMVAYLLWGLVPLYFHQVKEVPAGEILAHRIVWSVGLMAILMMLAGGGQTFLAALGNRKLVLTMLLSGSLLAVNWFLYIYATVTQRVNEAALGYYMMPLVNAFLATIFLGERLRPAHFPALALVALGVAIPFAWIGEFTWIAVALPITFGFYGLVRKMTPIDSFTGLCLETLLLAVPSAVYLLIAAQRGSVHFGRTPEITALLMFGGVVTVVPLLTFTLSIRRLPLLAVSFIQFISPTMQLIIGYYFLHETVGPERWAAMGCIWLAVLIFIADAVKQAREKRNSRRGEVDSMPLTINPDVVPIRAVK